jgi:hypothetical protein
MSHKHLTLLRSVFQEPAPANVHWREVESLLRHLGAEIEPAHGARFRILLNGHEGFLHHPHHGTTCSKSEIRLLRGYLASAGVSPSSTEG